MPMPCTFAIDYVLMPNGNNTQVVVASNIKPEDIKALVDRSVATAPGDKITAMIPADKPGFQIAMTLDYLEATMMLTPDGAPGQFVESFAESARATISICDSRWVSIRHLFLDTRNSIFR